VFTRMLPPRQRLRARWQAPEACRRRGRAGVARNQMRDARRRDVEPANAAVCHGTFSPRRSAARAAEKDAPRDKDVRWQEACSVGFTPASAGHARCHDSSSAAYRDARPSPQPAPFPVSAAAARLAAASEVRLQVYSTHGDGGRGQRLRVVVLLLQAAMQKAGDRAGQSSCTCKGSSSVKSRWPM